MLSMVVHGLNHVRKHVFMVFYNFKKCKKIGMSFIFNPVRLGQAENLLKSVVETTTCCFPP